MIHLIPLLLYAAALGLWVRELVQGPTDRSSLAPVIMTVAAVVAHLVALGDFRMRYGELPLVGPGAALSSLAFVGGLVLLVTLALREAARVAIGLLPFVVVVQGAAVILGIQPSPEALDLQGAGFVLHVGLAFLGYQGFAVASAAGFLYLVQHHELKAKRLGRFFRFLPPLTTLNRMVRIGLWTGFSSLSLALVLAWRWSVEYRGGVEAGDPKVVWALLSWIVLASVLISRVPSARRDYRGAIASVAGFTVVVVTYLVLRLTVGGEGFFL